MKMISEKRTVLAAQKRAVELLEAELNGMEAILALIPQTPLASTSKSSAPADPQGVVPVARSNGGRQPGAISNKWKRHLLALDEAKALFSLDDVIELVAERESRLMRPSEVKRIFEKYVEQGHVEEREDFYTVPEATVQKFRAALRDTGDDMPDEDEAASTAAKKEDAAPKQPEPAGYDLDDDIPFDPPVPKRGGYDLDDDIPF